MKQRLTYFISGHGDLTPEEFKAYYEDRIVLAAKEHANFIVGDFKGADTMAQDLLRELGGIVRIGVRVFHMFDKPRYLACPSFDTEGGFQSDAERDTAMTVSSDEDILWVRPGREKSGTAKNARRREEFV